VPDEVLLKVKGLSAAAVDLTRSGYPNQFVDTLQSVHADKKLVGRAVTLQLAPARPDVSNPIQTDWRAKGNQRALDH
jgi:regulator of RNase E activity RraA